MHPIYVLAIMLVTCTTAFAAEGKRPFLPQQTGAQHQELILLVQASSEKDAYNAAKAQNTVAAWQNFISAYPNGFRTNLARAYLSKLTGNQAAGPTTATTTAPVVNRRPTFTNRTSQPRTYEGQAEIAYWNSVRESNDAAIVGLYLKKYPQGSFAELANAIIRKLEGHSGASRSRTNTPRSNDTRESTVRKKVRRQSQPKPSKKRAIKKTRKKKQYKRKAETRKSRPKRQRRKRSCRLETTWECAKRGGRFEQGGCRRKRICN